MAYVILWKSDISMLSHKCNSSGEIIRYSWILNSEMRQSRCRTNYETRRSRCRTNCETRRSRCRTNSEISEADVELWDKAKHNYVERALRFIRQSRCRKNSEVRRRTNSEILRSSCGNRIWRNSRNWRCTAILYVPILSTSSEERGGEGLMVFVQPLLCVHRDALQGIRREDNPRLVSCRRWWAPLSVD